MPPRQVLVYALAPLAFAAGGVLLPRIPGFAPLAGLETPASYSFDYSDYVPRGWAAAPNTSCPPGAGGFSSAYNLPPRNEWPGVEVWATGTSLSRKSLAKEAEAQVGPEKMIEAEELCGRCLYHTLLEGRTQVWGPDTYVWVSTGDITDEWLRDGAVQVGLFLPRLNDVPGLRSLVDGAIRTMSFYTLQDPWANSFSLHYKTSMPGHDWELGRQGYVATRNFEVDSGTYYFNLLYNYYMTDPPIWGKEKFLNETIIHDAVMATLRLFRLEQRHENSPYRYVELPNNGKGEAVGYTGMVWGGFRPSDEMQKYGYNCPVNMYLVGALEKLILLNSAVWHDSELEQLAGELAEEIREGIERFCRVQAKDTSEIIYAYEVDGLGNHLSDFDDPNIPSLMSVPILGYRYYDEAIYARTRDRLNSPINPFYFETNYDQAKNNYPDKKIPYFGGQGSTHTPHGNVWPLGIMIEAIISDDAQVKADAAKLLLEMQCGNGLMHESNNVNNIRSCSRVTFEWANSLYVVFFESTFGRTCQDAFEQRRVKELGQHMKGKGLSDQGLFYGTMMSWVKHWTGLLDGDWSMKIKEEAKKQVTDQIREVITAEVAKKFAEWEKRRTEKEKEIEAAQAGRRIEATANATTTIPTSGDAGVIESDGPKGKPGRPADAPPVIEPPQQPMPPTIPGELPPGAPVPPGMEGQPPPPAAPASQLRVGDRIQPQPVVQIKQRRKSRIKTGS